MSRKIILSAGHGGNDPGAVSGKFIERDLAIELRNLVESRLKAAGVTVNKDPDKYALVDTLKWLVGKYKNSDILLDLHWNAGKPSANGTEIIVPQSPSTIELGIANELLNSICKFGFSNRGVKRESQTARKTLAWMRPPAENILIEVCFISNKQDMDKYVANKEAIACIIAETLIKYCK